MSGYRGQNVRRNAQHSATTCEHGTPTSIIEMGRYVLGRFDLDPCSSAYWNHYTVKATQFYDRQANGLKRPWFGSVILNAAGADEAANTDSIVRPMWARLEEHWHRGEIDGAVYVGYSLEQLAMLQRCRFSPMQCLGVVPRDRLRYLRRVQGGPPVPGDSPTHASFIALMTNRRSRSLAERQVARFVERAKKIGTLWRPW